MAKVYFHEKQTLHQNAWLWTLLIASAFGAIMPILYGMYWQLVKDKPWGNQPMSDGGLIAFFTVVLLVTGLTVWIVINLQLEVRIDEKGIHYNNFSIKHKWKLISHQEIDSYAFLESKKFTSMGMMHGKKWKQNHVNLFAKTLLSLRLKNGNEFKIGILNKDEVDWALKRLLTKNEIY